VLGYFGGLGKKVMGDENNTKITKIHNLYTHTTDQVSREFISTYHNPLQKNTHN
jgi:hypothetical protein